MKISASTAIELGERLQPDMTVLDDEALADVGARVVVACLPLVPGALMARPDNLTAPCAAGCGCTVQFRPHVPPDARTICLGCCGSLFPR